MRAEMDLKELVAATRPPFRTASAYVTSTLRQAILDNVLESGRMLRQEELASSFNVSRMPIREALRVLEAEGLVEFEPHRGAVVATLAEEDIAAVYDIRCALETLALRQSIPNLGEEQIARSAELLRAMEAPQDVRRLITLHREFHLSLCAAAPRKICEVLATQHDAIDRYLRVELAAMHNQDESAAEHRQLLDLCRARDVEGAVTLLFAHVAEAGHELVAVLRKRREASQTRQKPVGAATAPQVSRTARR